MYQQISVHTMIKLGKRRQRLTS